MTDPRAGGCRTRVVRCEQEINMFTHQKKVTWLTRCNLGFNAEHASWLAATRHADLHSRGFA